MTTGSTLPTKPHHSGLTEATPACSWQAVPNCTPSPKAMKINRYSAS